MGTYRVTHDYFTYIYRLSNTIATEYATSVSYAASTRLYLATLLFPLRPIGNHKSQYSARPNQD